MSVDQENEICGNCGVTIVCNNGVWVHTPEEWEISSETPECSQPEPLTAEQRELACRPSTFSAATLLITETLTSCSGRNSVSSGEMIDVLLDLQKHLNDLHRTALAAIKGWMAAVESNTYAGVNDTYDNDTDNNDTDNNDTDAADVSMNV